MAGLYRPNDNILIGRKTELVENKDFVFLSDIDTIHGAGRGIWKGAFDAASGGLYADYDLKIEFKKTVNIYGISTYNLGNSILNIYDENRNNLNIKYKTQYSNCNDKWTLMFKKIKPGIYIFNAGTSSYDSLISELFLEMDEMPYIIKKDNKYYNTNVENYDIVEKEYSHIIQTSSLDELLEANNFRLSDLFTEIEVNGETFQPISKFDNFRLCGLYGF